MTGADGKKHRPTDAYRTSGRHQLYNARPERNRKARRLACGVLIAVIFVGMFAQVFSLAQLMGQQKRIASVAKQVRELKSQKENMEVALNQYKRIDVLTERAAELGMVQPDAASVRTVSVTIASEESDTNAQTALGGENE